MFPLDLASQSLQPLVLLDDGLHVLGRGETGGVDLSFGVGRAYPLRFLCPREVLLQRVRRSATEEAGRLLREELPRQRAAAGTDSLRYFVDYLAPMAGRLESGPTAVPPVESSDEPPGLSGLAQNAPLPSFPTPSLWLLGRVWRLTPAEGGVHGTVVRFQGRVYRPAGESTSVGTLRASWLAALRRFAEETARTLATRASRETEALSRAREGIRRERFLLEGDLLYLPGNPALLGHLLPAHYNHVLGRECRHDLALVAPLTFPPRITAPWVVARSGQDWLRYDPPNGLCFGGDPPANLIDSPGVALVAYLRWAAIRLATNGKFHASDG